jgi:hypothetical protein
MAAGGAPAMAEARVTAPRVAAVGITNQRGDHARLGARDRRADPPRDRLAVPPHGRRCATR